jgi:hypothetical protein
LYSDLLFSNIVADLAVLGAAKKPMVMVRLRNRLGIKPTEKERRAICENCHQPIQATQGPLWVVDQYRYSKQLDQRESVYPNDA